MTARRTSMVRGTFAGIGADALSAIAALTITIISARALGPDFRGIYFLVILIATIAAMTCDLGLSTSLLAHSSSGEVDLRRLHTVSLVQSGCAGVLTACALALLKPLLQTSVFQGIDWKLLLMASLGTALLVYSQTVSSTLSGAGHVVWVSFMRMALAPLLPALLVAAIWLGGRVPGAAVGGWLAGVALTALCLLVMALRVEGRPVRPTREEADSLVRFGLRAYPGALSHYGFLRVDVLFISAQIGPAAVGTYSLSASLAERLALVSSALYNAAAPRIGSDAIDDAARLTAKMIRILVLVAVPVALVLALIAHPLINLLFGSRFEPAVTPFRILLPGTIALMVWYVTGLFVVVAQKRPALTTTIQIAALGACLPLYYASVREWGMTGAAVTSSLLYAALCTAGLVVLLRSSVLTLRALVPRPRELAAFVAAERRRLRRGGVHP